MSFIKRPAILGLAIGVGVTAIIGGIVALVKREDSSIEHTVYGPGKWDRAETEFDYSKPEKPLSDVIWDCVTEECGFVDAYEFEHQAATFIVRLLKEAGYE